MNINEYFSNTDSANAKLSSSLPQGPLYSKTIKNFYEDLIGPRLDEIDVKILKEWNDMLERYINLETPIYWIRKYESGPQNPTNNKQDNRRGALTLVVDDNDKIKFAYAFISNYDAQEIYSMIRAGVTPPTEDEFDLMMHSGSYKLHYDLHGGDCQDDQVTYYEQRGSVKSGVLNEQNWYLAHIYDVNGISYDNIYSLSNKDIEEIFLSRGHVADWKNVSSLTPGIQSFLKSSQKTSEGLTRKVRIIKISEVYDRFKKKVSDPVVEKDIDKLFKQILQASFYRFIHPCNYFLVPARKNECNFVYGRQQISIGEYKPLVEYVKNQIENKFKSHINFTDFLSKLMLPSSTVSKKSGSIDIHICYGTKYSDFCLQDKCHTVNYPSGYTDVKAFLNYYNASGKNIYLTIEYSIDGILNRFQTRHKNVSEKYIYDKIKNGKKIIEWIKLTIDIGPASPKTISKRKTSCTSTAPTYGKSSTHITTTILPFSAPLTSGITTIGQEMKAFFSNLLVKRNLNAAMIDNLRDPNYCRVNLGTSYPIIVDITTDSFDSRRYYKDIYLGTYRICSQWQKNKENDYRTKSMNWASKL